MEPGGLGSPADSLRQDQERCSVPLVDPGLAELRLWHARHQASPLRDIGGWDRVFPAPGDVRRPYDYRKHWNIAREAAGLGAFRFHSLRHTAETWVADAGVPSVVIAQTLGHKTMSMVKRYAHADVAMRRHALERMAALKGFQTA